MFCFVFCVSSLGVSVFFFFSFSRALVVSISRPPPNNQTKQTHRVPRKQGPAVDHLHEDTPDRPHVDRRRVGFRSQQNFRRPVPKGNDLVRVGADGEAKGAREAKVGQLEEVVGAVDEEVLGLEVAVEDAVFWVVGFWGFGFGRLAGGRGKRERDFSAATFF